MLSLVALGYAKLGTIGRSRLISLWSANFIAFCLQESYKDLTVICKQISEKMKRKRRIIYMTKQIADISNLLQLLETNTIKISNVRCELTIASDVTEPYEVTPTDFIDSMQYLNESKLFKDAVDFAYEWKNGELVINTGYKNLYMKEVFVVQCALKDGVAVKDIESKLRETIFHKMDEKIAV